MSASFESSPLVADIVSSLLSPHETEALRGILLAERAGHLSRLHAYESTAIRSRHPEDSSGLRRALDALAMFNARAAIEQFTEALQRMEAGRYGQCLVCEDRIPFETLETFPLAKVCPACDSAPVDASDARSRRAHRAAAPVRLPLHPTGCRLDVPEVGHDSYELW